MNRALPLIIALAAAGGGLAYFATQTPTGRVEPEADPAAAPAVPRDQATKPEKKADAPTTLADIGDVSNPRADLKSGTLERWQIVVMNDVGQPWPDARVTAKNGSETLTGSGNTTFEDVASGTWEIEIEVEGQPTWRRDEALGAGRSKRTIAYVGEEIRITGVLVDSYGAPVGDGQILFLPRGVPHPTTQESKEVIEAANENRATSRGVVFTRSARGSGSFKATLPGAGEYRVSIGPPGDARWSQKDTFSVTHGGPDRATVVIPPAPSLAVTTTGTDGERPLQMTAYTYDADLANRVLAQQDEMKAIEGGVDVQKAMAEARIKRAEEEGLEEPTGDGGEKSSLDGKSPKPLGDANRRTFERNMEKYGDGGVPELENVRAPLFEPGWKPVSSARFDRDGFAMLENLPAREDLRFLFIRGHEKITTQVPVRLTPERRSLGVVSLPPMTPPTGTPVQSNNATIRVSVDEVPEEELQEPGVTWTIGGR